MRERFQEAPSGLSIRLRVEGLGPEQAFASLDARFLFWLLPPRVQVPNNHILSKILTYITTILKTEYLIIGSFGPLGLP